MVTLTYTDIAVEVNWQPDLNVKKIKNPVLQTGC